jgi:hypothetical protein
MGKQGCEYALKRFSKKNNISQVIQTILNIKK